MTAAGIARCGRCGAPVRKPISEAALEAVEAGASSYDSALGIAYRLSGGTGMLAVACDCDERRDLLSVCRSLFVLASTDAMGAVARRMCPTWDSARSVAAKLGAMADPAFAVWVPYAEGAEPCVMVAMAAVRDRIASGEYEPAVLPRVTAARPRDSWAGIRDYWSLA